MSDMDATTARAFLRGGYRTITRPIRVMRRKEVLGTWYPAGTELPENKPQTNVVVARKAARQAERDEILRRINKGS